jgi:hypothetical protein
MVLEKSVEKVSKSLEKPPKARETSFKTPSLVGCKEDASFAGLSISKLQQGTFPLVKDFGIHLQWFFLHNGLSLHPV